MKKLYFLVAGVCLHLISLAQTDTTGSSTNPPNNNDTIRIGGMVIIRNGRHKHDSSTVHMPRTRRKPANRSAIGIGIDLGFNNYTDNTNYASTATQQFAPGATKDWFKLKNGKSVNVNLWFFMQRLSIIKNVVNLKYGLGLELNNYRYQENIRFTENPTTVYKDAIHYSKNKLAADYITIPLMLNFNFTPHKDNGRPFGFSAGASVGYLYASRQKFISGETGKRKIKDDFDLRPVKISYIAELQLGPVNLYGSMATQSIFEKGLDQTPYNVGIRLSRISFTYH